MRSGLCRNRPYIFAEAKFKALAKGEQITMTFGETFWSDGYGFCADRFGIQWQINCMGSKAMGQ